jgi:hypothetical protein
LFARQHFPAEDGLWLREAPRLPYGRTQRRH